MLDENQARVLAGEAFEQALEAFCASGDPERIRLLATYGARGLRRMLTGVYETLRSAGRELVLEIAERPGLEARIEELREAARCVARRHGRHGEGRDRPGERRAGARAARATACGRAADRPLRPGGPGRAT